MNSIIDLNTRFTGFITTLASNYGMVAVLLLVCTALCVLLVYTTLCVLARKSTKNGKESFLDIIKALFFDNIKESLQTLHRARTGDGKGSVWYSLLVYATEVVAIFGVIFVIFEFDQTQQALKEESVARAWQIVTTRAPGNSGKVAALETLGRELEPDGRKYVRLDGLNLSCDFMGGISEDNKNKNSKDDECTNPTYLANLDLSPAKLNKKKVNLSKADLTGAILNWAKLNEANLAGAKLADAELRRANLSEAYLFRANLSKADLSRANLTGAYLVRANLTGAYLTWANLSKADLSRANLSEASLTGANLSEADLTGANLTGAYLISANLSKADLTGANLTGAYLTGANLTGAKLNEANLAEADLTGAKLSCANFMDVKNIDTVKWFYDSAEMARASLLSQLTGRKPLPVKAWAWSDKRPFGLDDGFDKKIVYYEFDENAGQDRSKKPQNAEEVEFGDLPAASSC